MKIDSYNISTNSQHSYQKIEYTDNRYTAVSNPTMLPADYNAGNADADKAEISDRAKAAEEAKANADTDAARDSQDSKTMQDNTQKVLSFQAVKSSKVPDFAASVHDTKIKLLEQMIYALTGKKVKFSFAEIKMNSDDYKGVSLGDQMFIRNADGNSGNGQRMVGYTLESEHFLFEAESMDYQAQGLIKTADGRSISVDVNLHMNRAYSSYEHTSVELKKTVVDPLVINYGGDAASLAGETFDFDLDLDGNKDQIHFAGQGSGFLALDKNGDGMINDGSELFGPNTGSGFEELRMYDSDGNGWIDENDEIFDKLKVWSKDKDGNDQLFSLKEVDVGAIYLGETQTQFSMNDSLNNTMGAVRSTSFFLKESGGAGTINHIDLAL